MHYVQAKGILSANNGMNIYRGCSHGCIYCDSRSSCYAMPHDFEDIEVKINAPQLLEKALYSKRKKCMIATGSMSDPYNPYETSLRLTRQCLQVIDRCGFGVAIQTKSCHILEDLDLLKSINEKAKCVVQMTLTTYDEALCRIVEPNVSTTRERFEALLKFKEAGIPTIVWICPILPFINDSEENLRGLLDYCRKAEVKGIIHFGMGLTLRQGDREYYYDALDKHFKGLKETYQRVYGQAYELPSANSEKLESILHGFCQANGIMDDPKACFEYLQEFPQRFKQESLF